MKIGIYGGTFDPVHNEHVNIANIAIEKLGLDKLIILPAGEPPHKDVAVLTDAKRRLKMCELAFNNPKIEISSFEIDKKGKSYTIDTLEHFAKDDDELFCVIGGDSLAEIYAWKQADDIFEIATVVVVGRDEYSNNDWLNKYLDKILKLDYQTKELSSTEVRITCEFGVDISNLVPVAVNDYIKKHELYQSHRKLTKKVQKMITEKKYIHSMNTTICGMTMARSANVDKESAFIACALHDCAKSLEDYSEYKKKLKKENMLIPEPVVHAFVGSYLIKKEFNIQDKNIRNAVKYHTTARPNMSQLEKLVYVADCIEIGRDYEGIEEVRKTSKNDFEKTFSLCLNSTFSVLVDKTMCPLTLDAIDFYGR